MPGRSIRSPCLAREPIFDSLRRWTRTDAPEAELPVAATVAAMDGPASRRPHLRLVRPAPVMISNDEVASFVAQAPGRLVGVGSVDLTRPMAAVREIRRCVRTRLQGDPHAALAVGGAADRPALLSDLRRLLRGRAVCTQIGPHRAAMPSEVGRPIYLDQVAIDFPS